MDNPVARIFKTPELRRKILFTLGIVALYRLGTVIPTPGVVYSNVQECVTGLQAGSAGFYDVVNMLSGGALLQMSIFALGIMPYITASIIVQLLRVVIPHFEALQKEGQVGQAKLTQYTRYLTIFLAVLQASTIITLARSGLLFPNAGNPACANVVQANDWWQIAVMIIVMTAGTSLIMWLGELITERGVGNGMSLLIFTSIAAGFPRSLGSIIESRGWGTFWIILVVGILIMVAIVFVEQSQRRIPVQYAKRMVGRRTLGGSNTYIPIKVNQAGVVPVIFASSLLYLPLLITQMVPRPAAGEAAPEWVTWIQNNLTSGDHWPYLVVYTLLIIGFTYFYVAITFNPEEVADNMKKYGGFIPGYRAGRPTADYLDYVLTRITFPGSLYLAAVCLLPLIAFGSMQANQNFAFGGTSLLIIVGVGLETVKQINAQLQQRNYEGLLR